MPHCADRCHAPSPYCNHRAVFLHSKKAKVFTFLFFLCTHFILNVVYVCLFAWQRANSSKLHAVLCHLINKKMFLTFWVFWSSLLVLQQQQENYFRSKEHSKLFMISKVIFTDLFVVKKKKRRGRGVLCVPGLMYSSLNVYTWTLTLSLGERGWHSGPIIHCVGWLPVFVM